MGGGKQRQFQNGKKSPSPLKVPKERVISCLPLKQSEEHRKHSLAFKLFHKISQRGSKGAANFTKLNQIQPSFPTLIFTDERLWPFQFLGESRLRQASRFSRFREEFLQSFLACAVYGFRHRP
jgi:hypothetical protein